MSMICAAMAWLRADAERRSTLPAVGDESKPEQQGEAVTAAAKAEPDWVTQHRISSAVRALEREREEEAERIAKYIALPACLRAGARVYLSECVQ